MLDMQDKAIDLLNFGLRRKWTCRLDCAIWVACTDQPQAAILSHRNRAFAVNKHPQHAQSRGTWSDLRSRLATVTDACYEVLLIILVNDL